MSKSDRAFTRIADRVEKACEAVGHRKCHVFYSVYETDENDVPIDNLDEVAVDGRAVLVRERDNFFGGKFSRPYKSEILVNPTWLQVAVCANAMIHRTRDTHHSFLEGLERQGFNEEGIPVYRFSMGS
jgi:hypothetical protein